MFSRKIKDQKYDEIRVLSNKLNSNLPNVVRKNINYGENIGNLIVGAYGKVLIIYGYVLAKSYNRNYLLCTIDDVKLLSNTQIIMQVGSNPVEPYCMFGSISINGQITIGESMAENIYRMNCIAILS